MSGGAQASTPGQGSPLPLGVGPVQSAPPGKTTSLPASGPPPPAPISASTSATSFKVCSVSEPVCPVGQQEPTSASSSTIHTPSTHRKFVVADVAEEQDSPDELSAQGSTDSLSQGDNPQPSGGLQDPPTQPESSTGPPPRSVGGPAVEVIVVSTPAAVSDTSVQRGGEDVVTTRPPLMSAPSYSSTADPGVTTRQRSTSLPQKLPSITPPPTPSSTSTTEKSVVAPPTMPVIPEKSLSSELDVFTADDATHQTSAGASSVTESQSNQQQQHSCSRSQPMAQMPHPAGRPHPSSDHAPSSRQATPPMISIADISQQHSEALSNAFTYFIFSMHQILKDPAIQPLIHHLEHRYAGAHPSSNVAPPPSPPPSHPHNDAEKKDEDSDLKTKISK